MIQKYAAVDYTIDVASKSYDIGDIASIKDAAEFIVENNLYTVYSLRPPRDPHGGRLKF